MAWPRNGTVALAANAANANPATWNAGSMSGAVLSGDVLVAAVTLVVSGTPSDVTGITDSLGNAWTEITALRAQTALDGGFTSKLSVWVAISAAGTPSNITVAGTGTSTGQGIAVQAHTPSVAVTAPASTGLTFEATAVATGNSTTPDSGTSVGTTTNNDGLKLGIYSDDGAGLTGITAGTLDSAYTIGATNVNNTNAENALEYRDSTVSGATARANWGTFAAATFWAAGVVVIRKAAAGAVQAPFKTTDFYQPQGPVFPVTLRTFLNPGQQTATVVNPFNPYDYPNPRGAPFPLENRTFLNPIEFQLIGQDAIASQPRQQDWPVPRGYLFPLDLRTWTNPGLRIIVQSPFAQLDWQNPRGYAYPIDLRTFLNPMEVQLIGQDKIYGAAGQVPDYDWPNPRGAPNRVAYLYDVHGVFVGYFPAPAPSTSGLIYLLHSGRWAKKITANVYIEIE